MQQTLAEILSSSTDERQALYSAVAAKLETRAENIEKDLYFCWGLDFLFNRRKDDPGQQWVKPEDEEAVGIDGCLLRVCGEKRRRMFSELFQAPSPCDCPLRLHLSGGRVRQSKGGKGNRQ